MTAATATDKPLNFTNEELEARIIPPKEVERRREEARRAKIDASLTNNVVDLGAERIARGGPERVKPKKPALAVAGLYADKGWAVVPFPPRTKGCALTGWQNLRITSAHLKEWQRTREEATLAALTFIRDSRIFPRDPKNWSISPDDIGKRRLVIRCNCHDNHTH